MRNNTRKKHQQNERAYDLPLRGRRHAKAAPNSLVFFARVEGVPEHDGRVRGANGMRWRIP